jgi:hypothetical protein
MVFSQNNLQVGGKFKDDFRISKFGRFLRKIWLDELPMVWNLVRGDIKIVGVRPLSRHYFNLYSEELKDQANPIPSGLAPAILCGPSQNLGRDYGFGNEIPPSLRKIPLQNRYALFFQNPEQYCITWREKRLIFLSQRKQRCQERKWHNNIKPDHIREFVAIFFKIKR